MTEHHILLTINKLIESLNGRFRDKYLNANRFLSIDGARKKVDTWRSDYNGFRPHSLLGNLTPEQFRDQHIRSQISLRLLFKDNGKGLSIGKLEFRAAPKRDCLLYTLISERNIS